MGPRRRHRQATAADPSRIPAGRFGTVDEVADVADVDEVADVADVADVAVMLATNADMTGQTISLNGGVYYT